MNENEFEIIDTIVCVNTFDEVKVDTTNNEKPSIAWNLGIG